MTSCLEKIRTHWLTTEIAKYRTACLIFTACEIIVNVIRIGVLSYGFYRYALSLKEEVPSREQLILRLLSICIGVTSSGVDLALFLSMKKKRDYGLSVWIIISFLILFVATGSMIASFVNLPFEPVLGVSFLFDVIRIALLFFIVHRTMPIFSAAAPRINAMPTYDRTGTL